MNTSNFLFKFICVIIILVFIATYIPFFIYEIKRSDHAVEMKAWIISTCFATITLPLSLFGIFQHLIHYSKPFLQRHIIRILWMVPIYTINAWTALSLPQSTMYMDSLRECYEAYVIYNFMAYLLNFVYSEFPNFNELFKTKPQMEHFFLVKYFLPKWRMGIPFIQNCKHGVLQFTVLRVLVTIVSFIAQLFNKYGEGVFSLRSVWLYVMVVTNISQSYALYCLVMFYRATHTELKSLKPLGKFLCVKLIIFASFWQHLSIAILARLGVLNQSNTWQFKDPNTFVSGIHDFLISVEMLFFAIAHYFVFSHKAYILPDDKVDDASPPSHSRSSQSETQALTWMSYLRRLLAVSDVCDDVALHIRHVKTKLFTWAQASGAAQYYGSTAKEEHNLLVPPFNRETETS